MLRDFSFTTSAYMRDKMELLTCKYTCQAELRAKLLDKEETPGGCCPWL